MATTDVVPMYSAPIFKFLTNSMALAESRPRVELSQHCKGAPDRAASAIVTRFRLIVSMLIKIPPVGNSLSTRDTSDEIVSNNRVDGMGDTKDRHNDVSEVSRELRLGQSSRRVSRGSCLCSEASTSALSCIVLLRLTRGCLRR
jgi:hypothetical protein